MVDLITQTIFRLSPFDIVTRNRQVENIDEISILLFMELIDLELSCIILDWRFCLYFVVLQNIVDTKILNF